MIPVLAIRLAPLILALASARVATLPSSTASGRRIQPQPPVGSCHARGRSLFSLPDPRCTPGALNPAVTQSDIQRTICRSGFTARIRPPESITDAEKRAALRSYGDRRPIWEYEYDHLVPLELGGAVNDARNLWPEPGAAPNPKDRIESVLNARVCDGRMTLAAAQLLIARDWVTAYRRYAG